MPAASLLALALAASSPASDAALAAALRTAYTEPASLRGHWRVVDGERDGSRALCGRFDAGNAVELAVCTSYDDAYPTVAGRVDLWRLERTPRGAWRVTARRLGIETGTMGNPGDVARLPVAPGRDAFLVHSPYLAMGWASDDVTVYLAERGTFVTLLAYRASVENGGACTADTAAECAKTDIALDCRLTPDTHTTAHGFYPLLLHVSGTRKGRAVRDTLRIAPAGTGYRIARRTLERSGCDVAY